MDCHETPLVIFLMYIVVRDAFHVVKKPVSKEELDFISKFRIAAVIDG
jgi:hypothetical protein